jgi:hypothetical protein
MLFMWREIGGTPAMSADLTQFLIAYSRKGHDVDVPLAVRSMVLQLSMQEIKELVTGLLRGQRVEEVLRTYVGG